MEIPRLETERLLLRGLQMDDLDGYAAMYADAEVMRHLENGLPLDRAAAWRSMALHLGHWQLRGYGQWALVERSSQRLVGRAGLWQPEGWPGLEIGWLLARPDWGRGFATEAARSALSYAFDVVGAERVISLIRPENTASIRVAERLGERHADTIELHGDVAHVYAIERHGPTLSSPSRVYAPRVDLGDPTSYMVLRPGTPVYSAEGERIGTVAHVLADEGEDVFDGIVIGEHAFGEGHVFADADDIQEIHERGVVLNLDEAQCEHLPKPSANPAVMRDDPAETKSEARHEKLRRAWDRISGNY